MKLSEFIDWILRVVGILSILQVIIKYLFQKKVWHNDIKVTRKTFNDAEKDEFRFKRIYYFGDDPNEITIIQGTTYPIREIKVYDCIFNKNKLKKGEILYTQKNILPDEAVFLKLYYSCSMPNYIVEIINNKYEIAEILIAENGFNENVNYENGILYKQSFISIIYKMIFG